MPGVRQFRFGRRPGCHSSMQIVSVPLHLISRILRRGLPPLLRVRTSHGAEPPDSTRRRRGGRARADRLLLAHRTVSIEPCVGPVGFGWVPTVSFARR